MFSFMELSELSARTIRTRGDPSTPDTFGLCAAAQGVSRFTTTPARKNEFRIWSPVQAVDAASARVIDHSPLKTGRRRTAFRKKTVAIALFT
jgi:hypothetical protein